jgi:hypothetical protein
MMADQTQHKDVLDEIKYLKSHVLDQTQIMISNQQADGNWTMIFFAAAMRTW